MFAFRSLEISIVQAIKVVGEPLTGLYTGMRNEELYALPWDNVDTERRLIFVKQVWTKKDGFKDLTKNNEDRVVEIAQPLVLIFAELKKRYPDSSFVLPRIHDWDTGRQAEILRMFLAAINLPSINFHSLRATWATLLLSKGVEIAKVMKMGGWKNLKTLNDHYLRLSGVDIRGATDTLNLSASYLEKFRK
jgi:integrase